MAENPYGSYGSVSTVAPEGNYQPQRIQASPADMGAAIGQGLEKVGDTAQKIGAQQYDLATHMAQQATEAKVNDDFANKYAPAAAELRAQYDTLRGQDKIHGYDGYIKGLQDLNTQFIGNSSSPYEKHLMGSLINRHVASEIDGAKRELVQSQKEFADESTTSMLEVNAGAAAQNYNNPALVNSMMEQNDALLTMQHIDNGHDLNDPDHSEQLSAAQQAAKAQMTVGMVKSALDRGDVQGANQIRQQYGQNIPGYQMKVVDDTLHVANQRATGQQSVQALKAGSPIPDAIGAPPATVQAAVAKAAADSGIDPNTALTMLRIESMYGQNVGPNRGHHGDIGQTGLARGKPLEEQAAVMMGKMKEAQGKAETALGRSPQPWETYLCYQQGPGGGPALLKALQDNPKMTAVDALIPAYNGNRKMAVQAVLNNGGNRFSSVYDFAQHWQETYGIQNRRAMIEIPSMRDNGEQYAALETKLAPDQEAKFQAWLDEQHNAKTIHDGDYNFYKKNGYGFDYDFRAAFQAGVKPDPNTGHWGDIGKKPNHETFSDQSKYAQAYPDKAGHWNGDMFVKAEGSNLIPEGDRISAAILAPHSETGDPVQPAVTPKQTLNNFDEKYPDMLARAQAIPNFEIRNSVIEHLNRDRGRLAVASSAYTSTIVNQAQKMAQDPKFTDVSQIPPDMASTILSDSPTTYHYLETMADYNAKKSGGVQDKDSKEFGPGYEDLLHKAWEGSLTIEQLQAHLPYPSKGVAGDINTAGFEKIKSELIDKPKREGKGPNYDKLSDLYEWQRLHGIKVNPMDIFAHRMTGDITVEGYNALSKQFADTPEKKSESDLKKPAYDYLKNQIIGMQVSGYKDPANEDKWAKAQQVLYFAEQQAKAKGIPPESYLDINSKDFIGNAVKTMIPTPTQGAIDKLTAQKEAANAEDNSPGALTYRWMHESDPAKKLALEQKARELGYIQ